MKKINRGKKLSNKTHQKNFYREITGLFLLFFNIMLFLSYLSFWGVFGEREDNTPSKFLLTHHKNILGNLGDFLNWVFINLFGKYMSFFVIVLFFVASYNIIKNKKIDYVLRKIIYFTLLIILGCVIFSIPILRVEKTISFDEGGGFIGHFIVDNFLRFLFGREIFGAYLFIVFLILIWLVVGTSWSFQNAFIKIEEFVKNSYEKIKSVLFFIIDKIATSGYNFGRTIVADYFDMKYPKLPFKKIKAYSKNSYDNTNNNKSNLDKIIVKLEDIANKIEIEQIENKEKKKIEIEKDLIKETIEENFDDQPIDDFQLNKKDFKKIDEIEEKEEEYYEFPKLDLLNEPKRTNKISQEELKENGYKILEKLKHFKIEGELVGIIPGPIITRYEIRLAPTIPASRVKRLENDIAMALEAESVRIIAPIPGRNAIGIEVPNKKREMVYFKEIIDTPDFKSSKYKLPFAVGKRIDGKPVVVDLTEMPHLLIGGQTGAGKSVGLNTIIMSVLYSKTPWEARLILIDPKKVEFSIYRDIPHLLFPVVTEAKDALAALEFVVDEMDSRYRILSKVNVRNIDSFNEKAQKGLYKDNKDVPKIYKERMPYIVVIIDELADLMLLSKKEVEASIQRIAQLARAVGIHLVVATQRPSVDVITGVIKANLPSRIAFRTATATDSRTILDQIGAEKLLGKGDMLFYKTGAFGIERIHGAFISEREAEEVVKFISQKSYNIFKIEEIPEEYYNNKEDSGSSKGGILTSRDELLEEVAREVITSGQASATFIQRRFSLGFARAAKILDQLEMLGIVGPSKGPKPRDILVDPSFIDSEEWKSIFQ